MNRNEQIRSLTEGRDRNLVAWLSLEDWDKLPSEDLMDEINEAWDFYGNDTEGFTRIVRFLMGENTVTAKEVYDDLIRDPELRRKIVSYEFTEYEDGEYGFVQELERRYDVYGQVVYEAMLMVRLNFSKNL